jgi:isopentenyl phosphate kinase
VDKIVGMMANKKLIFIKLGGALITKSGEEKVADVQSIERLLNEIWEAKQKTGVDVVIGHGAGNFGHNPAKRYQTNKGLIDGDASRLGAIEVELAVMDLSMIVAGAGKRLGIPTYPIAPASFAVASDSSIVDGSIDSITTALEKGFIPLVRGDVMIDRKIGVSIGSTEEVFKFLASRMKPQMLILGTDVDGVFDKNPQDHKDAILIKKIDRTNRELVLGLAGDAKKPDVTGGMKGKVAKALSIADDTGCDVYIANAGVPGVIGSLVSGSMNGVRCTLITNK